MRNEPAARGRPLVSIRNVSKQFSNGTLAIRGVNLDIAAGEFLSLLGPSGCGKSTLLRIIAGLGAPERRHGVLADLRRMTRAVEPSVTSASCSRTRP